MATINLKDFYYWYTQDQFIEVSDEVAEVFLMHSPPTFLHSSPSAYDRQKHLPLA